MRSLLLAGFLLGISLVAQAQKTVVANVFGLRPSAGSSRHTVELGATKSQVMRVLGPPTKTSRFYSEIDEQWWPLLHYGSNKLYFNDNSLALAELNDSRLTVGKAGTAGFRVGSVLPKATSATAKPALAFGNFSVEHKPGKSRNLKYSAISYGHMKTEKGEGLDVLYEIQYDQQGRVTHIALDSTYD
jgi:hypothetical protein